MRWIIVLLLLCLSWGTAPVTAQSTPLCPARTLLALARAASTCYGQSRGEACYANGLVESTVFAASSATSLAQPGDRRAVSELSSISVLPHEEDISVASLYIQGNLTDAEQRSIVLMLLGEASLTNQVPPLAQSVVQATGALNIRRAPQPDSEIIARLGVGGTTIANGRTAAADWLRVRVPNSNDLGWVSAASAALDGNPLSLSVVRPGEPLLRPYQYFTFSSVTASLCDGALPFGLLLQTPVKTQLRINNVDLLLSGTFFFQSDDLLSIHVLQGEAVALVADQEIFIPAAARLSISSDDANQPLALALVEPFDPASLAALPINNLPIRLQLPQSITAEDIERLTAEYHARTEPTPIPTQSAQPDTTCRRQTSRRATLWAGPAEFYEAVNNLPAGTAVSPVIQTTDTAGNVWWQLRSSNWIKRSDVQESGNCDPVPVADQSTAPRSNTLSLETCETTNGPLRAGQNVRIQFQPLAFDNLGEARDATLVDPGKISIGSQSYRARATAPIRLGTEGERYIRQFYINWVAEPGTYRIVGERLSYIPICSITVPVG